VPARRIGERRRSAIEGHARSVGEHQVHFALDPCRAHVACGTRERIRIEVGCIDAIRATSERDRIRADAAA